MSLNRFLQTRLILNTRGAAHENNVEISVIVPVYNQENIIVEVLRSVATNMNSIFELIIIDDASTDSTLDQVLQSATEISKISNIASIQIYRNRISRFEVYCDSYGVSKSQGTYCLEVQADILMDDPGFDLRLINAIESNDNLVMLSGRGVETLTPIINFYRATLGTDTAHGNSVLKHLIQKIKKTFRTPKNFKELCVNVEEIRKMQISSDNPHKFKTDEEFLKFGIAGRSGEELSFPLQKNFPKDRVYVGQTVMRGPLFFKAERFKQIGTFDTNTFFQGFDDHDFCARAMSNGYLVGYYPLNFISPLQLGTTRKRRSLATEFLILLNIFRIRRNGLCSQLNDSGMPRLIGTHENQILRLR